MNPTQPPGGESAPSLEASAATTSHHTPAPREAQAPKRLFRDPHGPIGGVAGGFAAYFDIDPVLSRLLWVAALFSGVGIPAYVVCWVVIPKAKVWPPPSYQARRSGAQSDMALASGLLIVGLAALIGIGFDGLGQYLFPAALIGFGVYLLNQRAQPVAAPPPSGLEPSGAPAFARAAAASAEAPPDVTSAAPDTERPSERTGLITPSVLSLLAIAAGVLIALHAADFVDVSIAAAAAGALVVVGAGLVASLWLGSARGLVPLGLALMGVMFAASSVAGWFEHTDGAGDERRGTQMMGEQIVAPRTLAELQPSYHVGMGSLTLDLSALELAGEPRELPIHVGLGKAVVIVPAETPVEVHGSVGLGELELFGAKRDGAGVDFVLTDPPGVAAELIIDMHIGAGEGQVQRDE